MNMNIMDTSALSISPNRSIQTITLDSDRCSTSPQHQNQLHQLYHQNQLYQHQLQHPLQHQRLERPQDAFQTLFESSPESLARIDLSHHHQSKQVPMTEAGTFPASASAMSIAGTSKQVTSNSTRSRKTVRFAGSDDNDSNNSCHVDGTVVSIDDIDQKTGDQLYWTEAQLLQFQRQAKQVARKYRQNIPYVAAVKRILQSHRSVSSDNAADSNVNTAAADAAADVVQVLVESAARGLESHIVPLLKLHRKRTIRAVLELQDSLRLQQSQSGGEHDKHTVNSKHAETVRHLLRRKSMQASRPWRHLARQLAVGDAAAAHIDGPSMMTLPTPSGWLQQEKLQQQPQQHSTFIEA